MMMSLLTDGCAAMIGTVKGAQKHISDAVPTLLAWGGRADHDLANLLKSAVGKLSPDLPSILSALHGSQAMAERIGLEIKKVLKLLSVRFRVIQGCCEWLESQDRGVYVYFKKMKKEVLTKRYEPSETEMIVLEKYIGNYPEVKLSSLFILDVCDL